MSVENFLDDAWRARPGEILVRDGRQSAACGYPTNLLVGGPHQTNQAGSRRSRIKGPMTTQELRLQAEKLRRSERGDAVLQKLIELRDAGASGLDAGNQRAALNLFLAMFQNPWDWPAELHKQKEVVS